MGGGGASSSSRPVLHEGQEQVWRYHGTDTAPMARGQETPLTRLLEQSAMDEAEKQRGLQTQGIIEMAGRTGMGVGEIASLQRGAGRVAMEQALGGIAEMRRLTAFQAMNTAAGLPISPSMKTRTRSEGATWQKVAAGTVAAGVTVATAGAAAPVVAVAAAGGAAGAYAG